MMKAAFTTAIALALSATIAHAEVSIDSGAWRTYRDVTSTGKQICGMQTYFPGAKASIMVKYVEGDGGILIHMMKDSWRFPADQPISIRLIVGFDGYSQPIDAKGGLTENGNSMVEFRLGSGIDEFLRAFGDANFMWIEYPDGDEPRWSARMVGSRKAAGLFRICTLSVIDQFARKSGKPTQPYGSRKATQPTKQPAKADDGSI